LLQHSLGGENITTLIATISPSALNSDVSSAHTVNALLSMQETLNTLEYASRAKQIVNQPSINSKVTVSDMLHIMQERYRALMNDVTANQKMSGVYMARENYE
jgi:kinesin family protein 11